MASTSSPLHSQPTSRTPSSSGHGTTNTAPASSVRSRNRRPVATELQESSSDTPHAADPLPGTRPSHGSGRVQSSAPRAGTSSLGKGWSQGNWSWSTLQGFANAVLSGDMTENEPGRGRESGARSGKLKMSSWGPEGLPQRPKDHIGTGTEEARRAEVRARRAADVLQSHDNVNGGLDINGQHKKRTSSDMSRPIDEEEETMVYLHRVQPQDSIVGLVLKYSCDTGVFKKANGLWSNDSIQTRKIVYLPVEACGVRGRPCDPSGKKPVDLLAPTPEREVPQSSVESDPWGGALSSPDTTAVIEDTGHTHVRWVQFSPSSEPVEVVRLPRKSLGFFPPRRRKSLVTESTASTPRVSLDRGSRHSEAASHSRTSTPSRPTNSIRGSFSPEISAGSYFPTYVDNPASMVYRPVRPATAKTPKSQWMSGPGGVGTMERNVRMPGPAPDGLTKWTRKHLPGLAGEDIPSISVMGSDVARLGFSTKDLERLVERGGSGAVTPSNLDDQSGLGLENAAAAIETWIRRLAVKGPGTPRLAPHRPGQPPEPQGDLIELLDGTSSDDGRSFIASAPSAGSATLGSTPGGSAASGRSGGNGVRGRLAASSAGKKSD